MISIERKHRISERWDLESPQYVSNLAVAATLKSDTLLQTVYDEASQYNALQALSRKYKGKTPFLYHFSVFSLKLHYDIYS